MGSNAVNADMNNIIKVENDTIEDAESVIMMNPLLLVPSSISVNLVCCVPLK